VACSWVVRAEIEAAAASLGVSIDARGWERLEQLLALWRRYGRAVNLTGATRDEALADHVAEALVTVACAARGAALAPETRWVDVGSGGGFPALVAAAITPCSFHLVEPRQKRAAFLELALSTIGVSAVVSRARLEGATWNENGVVSEIHREISGFSIATSRAVFGPEAWIALGEDLVIPGGVVIAHVLREVRDVGGRVPEIRVQGERTAALGFRVP
jgi:16S rRNA (guanine527-N7)-methyltransferase